MKTNQEKYGLSRQKIAEENNYFAEKLETNKEIDRNIELKKWIDECVNARMWNNLKKNYSLKDR